MPNITPHTASAWSQTQVKEIIENIIAAQKAKSRTTGWSTADNVLASYTLWEARLGSNGWMVKCVESEPTSGDFSQHIKKGLIKARLSAQPCAPAYVVERRDKGNVNTPKVAFAFHFQL
jgi:hypothetical protein